MKKLSIFCAVLFVAVSFASCNKKKIEDLEKEIDDLKSAQSQTQSQTNSHSLSLQSGSPVVVNFKGNRGFDSAAYNYTLNYDFAWSEANDGNYATDNGDGTYDFYVERYSNVVGNRSAYIEINGYDPAVGINSASIYVYAEEYFQQADTSAMLYLEQNGYLNSYGADNITVNSFSFNPDSRAFSIDLTINSTEADPQNSSDNAAVVRVTNSGTLVYSDVVYRKGVN